MGTRVTKYSRPIDVSTSHQLGTNEQVHRTTTSQLRKASLAERWDDGQAEVSRGHIKSYRTTTKGRTR